jgi:hypothetical protein
MASGKEQSACLSVREDAHTGDRAHERPISWRQRGERRGRDAGAVWVAARRRGMP